MAHSPQNSEKRANHFPEPTPGAVHYNVRPRKLMDSAALKPKIQVIQDRRLIMAFLFTVLPAVPVFVGSIYLLSRPDGLNFIIHPLGLVFLAGGLLLAALPVRLAMYVFALRESSPQSSKLWAAIQCAVPALGVFLFFPAARESGFTAGRISLIAFFGCYLAALVILLLHIVRDAAKRKNA